LKRHFAFLFISVLPLLASGQQAFTSEELFREYFIKSIDSIDVIEGIWTVSTTQEFYRYDTLYDVVKIQKAARVAIIKKQDHFESYDLTGQPYDVQFSQTDVDGVYMYRNYFPGINQFSETQAVISKAGEMEYTYDFPDDYLRAKFGDSYEEGTRVVNILKWSRIFPEVKKSNK
jgi:hypothetical protein